MGLTAETATRLVARYGQTVTLLRAGEPVDDVGGIVTPGVETEQGASGFVASYSDEVAAADSATVIAGDVKVLAVTPEAGDRTRIGRAVLNVVRVSPVAPGGLARFWSLRKRAT